MAAPTSAFGGAGMSTTSRRLVLLAALASGAGVAYYLNHRPDPAHPYKHAFSHGLGLAKAYTQLAPYLLPYMDPERGHRLAVYFASLPASARYARGLTPATQPHPAPPATPHADLPQLATQLFGLHFTSPLGMAAGFDKNAECIEGLLDMGFGFVEVGSVTPEPQPGNDLPRVFRLNEERAIINRYGFNSDGVERVKQRLEQRRQQLRTEEKAVTAGRGEARRGRVVGINLGKNKTSPSAIADYSRGLRELGQYADYAVINISSPNTPGLRDLQGKRELHSLLSALISVRNSLPPPPSAPSGRRLPLLVKIAPDLTADDKADIAEVVLDTGIDGLVVSNTTISRPPTLTSPAHTGTGGLSGRPLSRLSTETIRDMYVLTGGRVPIVGVGGVESGADVWEKMRAGASVVQLYSAFVFDGPCVTSRIKAELCERMAKEGVANVSELVGAGVKDEVQRRQQQQQQAYI